MTAHLTARQAADIETRPCVLDIHENIQIAELFE